MNKLITTVNWIVSGYFAGRSLQGAVCNLRGVGHGLWGAMCEMLSYWRLNKYMALYELQKFKDCDRPQNKHHKKRHKNVMRCFILNEKELPIYYSTIADVFRDLFCDVYLRSFKVLHFRSSHVVIETPINFRTSNLSVRPLSCSRCHELLTQNVFLTFC